eukprot:comp11884_c0_seq1/m.6529 comp11884_c0_seq1/g.6529  ORF comp11884_c0_seq1/g.6529 comp11884_c0_seq1/m.6529 type:complete len:243 (-) comp11884_c0_seq1:16-744(-)
MSSIAHQRQRPGGLATALPKDAISPVSDQAANTIVMEKKYKCTFQGCISRPNVKRNNIERHVWTQHIRDTLHASSDKYLASLHKDHVDRYVTTIWEPATECDAAAALSKPGSSNTSAQSSPRLETGHTPHYPTPPYQAGEVPTYRKDPLSVTAPVVPAVPYWHPHVAMTCSPPQPSGNVSRWQELQNVVNAQLQATMAQSMGTMTTMSQSNPPMATTATSIPVTAALVNTSSGTLWRPFEAQ